MAHIKKTFSAIMWHKTEGHHEGMLCRGESKACCDCPLTGRSRGGDDPAAEGVSGEGVEGSSCNVCLRIVLKEDHGGFVKVQH